MIDIIPFYTYLILGIIFRISFYAKCKEIITRKRLKNAFLLPFYIKIENMRFSAKNITG